MSGKPFWRVVACLTMVLVISAMAGAATLDSAAFLNELGASELDCAVTAESTGPADGCCDRHLEVCESLCSTGTYTFTCSTTDTGGCSSSCKCGTGGEPQV